jgi:hypothetical protein
VMEVEYLAEVSQLLFFCVLCQIRGRVPLFAERTCSIRSQYRELSAR